MDHAFQRLDVDQQGWIHPADLANKFDASRAPEVLAGRLTKDLAFEDFVTSFVLDSPETVTRSSFVDFHADLSASIEKDEYFELYVNGVWRLAPLPRQFQEPDDDLKVVARHTSGRQTLERLSALELKAQMQRDAVQRDPDLLVAALHEHNNILASSAAAVTSDVASAADLVNSNHEDRHRGKKIIDCAGARPSGGPALPGKGAPSRRPPTTLRTRTVDPGVAAIAAQARADLTRRGLRAFVDLDRALRRASLGASQGTFSNDDFAVGSLTL